jgi:CelD/BcsL family acetyltransferase involved in cellulose biosynthesis
VKDRIPTPIRGAADARPGDSSAPATDQADGVLFVAYQGTLGLQQLAPEWEAMAASIPGASFNHFPGWYRAYLASNRCDPAKIWFIAAYRKQRLVAIFPLQFQTHLIRVLRPRCLGTIDDDELQLSDFVFAPTAANASLLYELTRWLRTQRILRWDVLRMLKVPDNSSLAYAARARLPSMSIATRYEASAYFDTSGTYERATHAMTSKFKSNLRRRTHLAEKIAPLRFQSYRGNEALQQAFDIFLDIEASGWKGPEGTSSAIRCRPKVLAFYTDCVREFAARYECVINLLWHGEQAIAGQFGLQIGRTLHILKVGYRDVNSVLAPGILLQDRTIRYACEDSSVDVLSMVNDPYWARSFKPETVDVWLYFTPNWNARGLLAHFGIWLKRLWKARSAQAPLAGRPDLGQRLAR